MSVETSKLPENIFSWRNSLKTLPTQERADFYYQKLTNHLADKVMEAELARQEVNNNTVREIIDNCASNSYQSFLERKLVQREQKSTDIKNARKKIDLAMAGFFRIDHGQDNAMAKRSKTREEKQEFLENAKTAFNRHISVERTTQNTPYTIHGGSINWNIEISQDLANTYLIEDSKQMSELTLQNAIATSSEQLNALSSGQSEYEEKFYTGTLSGLGVLYTRLAKLTGNLNDMLKGVSKISQANTIQPNYHRLATVSFWLLKASFNYPKTTLLKRIKGVAIATKNLTDCLLHEPKSTVRAIKQSFKK